MKVEIIKDVSGFKAGTRAYAKLCDDGRVRIFTYTDDFYVDRRYVRPIAMNPAEHKAWQAVTAKS